MKVKIMAPREIEINDQFCDIRCDCLNDDGEAFCGIFKTALVHSSGFKRCEDCLKATEDLETIHKYRAYDRTYPTWLGKSVIHKPTKEVRWITDIEGNRLVVSCRSAHSLGLEEFFINYIWADGTVCGVQL